MARVLSSALLSAAAALVLAACADTVTSPKAGSDAALTPSGPRASSAPADVGPDELGWENAHIHIMPLKSQAQEAHSQGGPPFGGGGGGGGNGISYHGGPVLQQATNVVAVYWSSSTIYNGGPTPGSTGGGTGDGSLVGHFLRNLGGSNYFNINTSYTDGSQAIKNVVNYNGFWANNTNAPSGKTRVSDAQMVAMLQSGFDTKALTYDGSTLYAIFTAGQVNLGGGFGTRYCAYHTHGTVTINGVSKTVLYAAMPYDYAYPGACTNGTTSPNNDPGADGEVNTLAHEIEETTTDMMGNAWYDSQGYENADKCAWTWGTTYKTPNGGTANMNLGGKDFLVQQNWLNASGGKCVLSY